MMIENQKIRPAKVIGPLGEPLTLETLPPPSTTRWVVRRKAEVVAAVNGGLLSVDEVCDRIWPDRRGIRRVAARDRPVGDARTARHSHPALSFTL
jgi:hypothetical protein